MYSTHLPHTVTITYSGMRVETNVSMLLDAIYIITMLLPVVPDGMVKHFYEIFDGFLRIAHLSFYNKGKYFLTYTCPMFSVFVIK